MVRITALILTIALCLSMVACGLNAKDNSIIATDSTTTDHISTDEWEDRSTQSLQNESSTEATYESSTETNETEEGYESKGLSDVSDKETGFGGFVDVTRP